MKLNLPPPKNSTASEGSVPAGTPASATATATPSSSVLPPLPASFFTPSAAPPPAQIPLHHVPLPTPDFLPLLPHTHEPVPGGRSDNWRGPHQGRGGRGRGGRGGWGQRDNQRSFGGGGGGGGGNNNCFNCGEPGHISRECPSGGGGGRAGRGGRGGRGGGHKRSRDGDQHGNNQRHPGGGGHHAQGPYFKPSFLQDPWRELLGQKGLLQLPHGAPAQPAVHPTSLAPVPLPTAVGGAHHAFDRTEQQHAGAKLSLPPVKNAEEIDLDALDDEEDAPNELP